MCGGIFYHHLARNVLLILLVKDFENRSAFGKVRGKNIVTSFFWTRCKWLLLAHCKR